MKVIRSVAKAATSTWLANGERVVASYDAMVVRSQSSKAPGITLTVLSVVVVALTATLAAGGATTRLATKPGGQRAAVSPRWTSAATGRSSRRPRQGCCEPTRRRRAAERAARQAGHDRRHRRVALRCRLRIDLRLRLQLARLPDHRRRSHVEPADSWARGGRHPLGLRGRSRLGSGLRGRRRQPLPDGRRRTGAGARWALCAIRS